MDKSEELAEQIERIKAELIAEITEHLEKSMIITIGSTLSQTDALALVTKQAEEMIEDSLPDGYKVKMTNPHYDGTHIVFDGFTILRDLELVSKFKRSSMKEENNGSTN